MSRRSSVVPVFAAAGLFERTNGLDGPNIGDEFSSLEFWFQEILPLGRNLIVRDQLSVVGYDCQGACNAYHVSLDGMNHPWIHLEHILLGHARDVVLHQVRYVFRDKVEVGKGNVPPLLWPDFISIRILR